MTRFHKRIGIFLSLPLPSSPGAGYAHYNAHAAFNKLMDSYTPALFKLGLAGFASNRHAPSLTLLVRDLVYI